MAILRCASSRRRPCWTATLSSRRGHATGTLKCVGGATRRLPEKEFAVPPATARPHRSDCLAPPLAAPHPSPCLGTLCCHPHPAKCLPGAGRLAGGAGSPLFGSAGVRPSALWFPGPYCFDAKRTTYDIAPPIGCGPRLSKSALSFEGPEAGSLCTQGKSWPDLFLSATVFGLCASERLVRNSQRLLDISSRVVGERATMWLLKRSFYRVFCGGEDLAEVRLTMDNLQRRGTSGFRLASASC